jgi:hypothetical protein
MENKEKKGIDKSKKEESKKSENKTKSEMVKTFFDMNKNIIVTIGSFVLFFISIFVGVFSGSNISVLLGVRTVIIISLVIFACLSPVLILHTIKGLRHFIVDEELEKKNRKISDELSELASSLQISIKKFDKSIDKNEHYFKDVIIPHIDECSRVDNLVRRSRMINNVDDYYQQLTKAREQAVGKNVYLTNFSTKPYLNDNKYRDEYYSTDIEFIKRNECQVYRIVTVHSLEKLVFLKKLVEDAKNNEPVNYNLAYLDIEEFSNETGDKLPGIIGMDIIENEVIIMDFRYARALRKHDGFERPLYIESEKIADMCRDYYKMIWEDISDETPMSKRRYNGYKLYNGSTKSVNEGIDNIWKEIESKITVKNSDNVPNNSQ